MTNKMIKAMQTNQNRQQGAVESEVKSVPQVDVRTVPAGILAYLGDSVYEIIIRNYFIKMGYWDSHKLHKQVINFVKAEGQASVLRAIMDHLTEEEQGVMRRGRNSNAGNVPKNANVADYRYSTALEAVLGYLMLKGDEERLEVLIHQIEQYIEEQL